MTASNSPVPMARAEVATASGGLLWRHRPFRLYLLGETASVAGTSVSGVAVPLLAVVELDATTGQVAALAVLAQLPTALFALHAGALGDRLRKRPLMITGDLVCALALATLPVAAALHVLTMGQLMAVVMVDAVAALLHDAAAISYLPSLVDRSLIQQSNSRIGGLFSVAATAGANLGAMLVGALGAARALTADALSYLVSAWCIARIRLPEPEPSPPQGSTTSQIREGLTYVFGNPTLRTLTLTNATMSVALAVMNTLWALFLLRELHMSATALGGVMGMGGIGSCAGALLAPRWSRRFGPGPMMVTALAVTPLVQVPLLLAGPGLGWQLFIGAALVVQLACASAAGTTQRSIRQMITQAGLQSRMQAVSTWLTGGSRPLAAAVAGVLGTWLGLRTTLTIGALLLIVPVAVFARSPLRTVRTLPIPAPLPDDRPREAGP
ncbi:MFS transporter [Streptomyces sp. NPDC050485]|uniref:MFS transporter n=1 Tax=Streptomyces sp. NPDC050485 TaxID=3365617 RepID=UPI0037B2596D